MRNIRIWRPLGMMDSAETRADKRIITPLRTRSGGGGGNETQNVTVRYEFRGFWQDVVEYEGISYCRLEIDGGGHLQQPGVPYLPQEGVYIHLPLQAEYVGMHIDNCEEETIMLDKPVLPVPQPALEGEELVYRQDRKVYGTEECFPGQPVIFSGVRNVEGHRVIHLLVYPVRYLPGKRRLQVIRTMNLTVSYKILPEIDVAASVPNGKYKDRKIEILGLPESEEMDCMRIGGYENIADLKGAGYAADVLIITTGELCPAFQEYLEEKGRRFKLVMVEVERIGKEFPNDKGMDYSIRDFLKFVVENWVTAPRYVILGGNIREVPTHWEMCRGASIPSDHFYADLTGDICPDVVVSRFPASGSEQMRQMCAGFIRYEKEAKAWGKKVLLTTFDREDYTTCTESIAEIIGNDFQVYKRYDGEATKEEVIGTIEEGVGFINYRGHGVPTGWQAGNGLRSTDLVRLENAGKVPQVLSIACSNNALKEPACFGCEWIRKGKAVSFLGASVPSYTIVNHEFDKCLWEGIAQKGLRCAGDIFNYGIHKLYVNIPDSELVVHTIYAYLLLGDPTVECRV